MLVMRFIKLPKTHSKNTTSIPQVSEERLKAMTLDAAAVSPDESVKLLEDKTELGC